jgi:hypothetical protein
MEKLEDVFENKDLDHVIMDWKQCYQNRDSNRWIGRFCNLSMSYRAKSFSKSPEKEIGTGSPFRIVNSWERRSFRYWQDRWDECLTRARFHDPIGKNNPVEKNPIFLIRSVSLIQNAPFVSIVKKIQNAPFH